MLKNDIPLADFIPTSGWFATSLATFAIVLILAMSANVPSTRNYASTLAQTNNNNGCIVYAFTKNNNYEIGLNSEPVPILTGESDIYH